jgi:hypothetical protein
MDLLGCIEYLRRTAGPRPMSRRGRICLYTRRSNYTSSVRTYFNSVEYAHSRKLLRTHVVFPRVLPWRLVGFYVWVGVELMWCGWGENAPEV